MSSSLFALLAAVSLAAALPARAGEPERKAVHELVELVMPKSIYERMVGQMTQQIVASIKTKDNAPLPRDLTEKISLSVQDALPYEEMVSWSVEIYASRFTLEEIGEMKKFYSTPLGKKLAQLLPEIAAASAKKVGEVMPERLPAAMKKHGLGR